MSEDRNETPLSEGDIRRFFSDRIGNWDLDKDVTLTIRKVQQEDVMNPRTWKPSRKVTLYFEKASKSLVLNRTNMDLIGKLYGYELSGWVGKRITLYRDKCDAFGKKNVPCVRVRPSTPKGAA